MRYKEEEVVIIICYYYLAIAGSIFIVTASLEKFVFKKTKRGSSTLIIEVGYPAPDTNLEFIPVR